MGCEHGENWERDTAPLAQGTCTGEQVVGGAVTAEPIVEWDGQELSTGVVLTLRF